MGGWPIVLKRDAHTDSQHANTHDHLLGWHCAHHEGGTPFSRGLGANCLYIEKESLDNTKSGTFFVGVLPDAAN